jgi:zinc transport system ATP-binding protein
MLFMVIAEKLCFSYTSASPYVLNGIDLEIRNGEYVSVVGENGSGKTTLMRLILKFIKPTNGCISTEAKRIGYVPQKHDYTNANFPITVSEALNSYRKLLHVKSKSIIKESLEQVGMADFAGALMGTLSGGQSQKVLIARALMGSPDLLIFDEPSTGVDVGSQKEIYGIIKRINQENGITIVSVEHNLDAAVSNSTLIYHIAGGRGHLCTPRQYANEFLKSKGGGDANA